MSRRFPASLRRGRVIWISVAAAVIFSFLSWFYCVPRAVVLSLMPTSSPATAAGALRHPALKAALDVPYPLAARRRGIEGTVTLSLRVSEKGEVSGVEVVHSPHPLLAKAAREAAAGAEFTPAMKDGRPVAATVRMPIRFQLK